MKTSLDVAMDRIETPANSAGRAEIIAAIEFYQENAWDWLDVVTFLGIRHIWGGWQELRAALRPQWTLGRPRNE